jgi:hypothetical protein
MVGHVEIGEMKFHSFISLLFLSWPLAFSYFAPPIVIECSVHLIHFFRLGIKDSEWVQNVESYLYEASIEPYPLRQIC